MSILELMSFLVDGRSEGLPPNVLADIFDRMIWILADNGEGISKVQLSWLQGSDEFRIEIALHMSEVCPFLDNAEMNFILEKIEKEWPRLAPLCREFSLRWIQPGER